MALKEELFLWLASNFKRRLLVWKTFQSRVHRKNQFIYFLLYREYTTSLSLSENVSFAIASSFEAEIKICATTIITTTTAAWNENNGTRLGWILITDEGWRSKRKKVGDYLINHCWHHRCYLGLNNLISFGCWVKEAFSSDNNFDGTFRVHLITDLVFLQQH